MSIARTSWALAAVLLLGPASTQARSLEEDDAEEWEDDDDDADADADDDDDDDGDGDDDAGGDPIERQRFFEMEEEVEEGTAYAGYLTWSNFFYTESASGDDPLIVDANGQGIAADVASRVDRLFTDLRVRFDAKHISGGNWGFRSDARLRLVPELARFLGGASTGDQFRTQSGTFGEPEYAVRALHLVRRGDRTEVLLGRQYAIDVAYTKIDGVQVRYRKDEHWKYSVFGGLYPTRGSRSIDTDYPKAITFDAMGGVTEGSRVVPIAGGVSAAYRFPRLHGAVGIAGIVPNADDIATGEAETPRVFLTSTGYWRKSNELDFYHYAVIDAAGAGGSALTNVSLGMTYAPQFNYRFTLSVNQVDTETLNVQVQNRLENPQDAAASPVANNIAVTRLARQSARAALSAGFVENRFEVTVSGNLRRRPDVELQAPSSMTTLKINASEAADIGIDLVDRRSFGGVRFGAHYTRTVPLGVEPLDRSTWQVLRVDALRRFDKGEVEAALWYVDSDDSQSDETCAAQGPVLVADPLRCYGTSKATSYTLGLVGSYRLSAKVLGIASANLGFQDIESTTATGTRVQLPKIRRITAYARILYRF